MRRRYIYIVLLGVLPFIANAQFNNAMGEKQPKLVVGITIEQMRPEYLDRFWSTFQEDGFKRLITHGAVCQNTRIDIHNLKLSTGMATIMTGTYPSVHGIIGDKWFKQLTNQYVSAVTDNYYLTVGSDSNEGNCSANQLKVFTVGDVMKQYFNGKAKVYSVALNASAAVFGAGHNGDGAFWFDKTNGNFISSSYYFDTFPLWVQDFNSKGMPSTYLTRTWDLLLPKESYNTGVADDYLLEKGFWSKYNTFPYNLKKMNENNGFNFELLKATPYGNKLVRDFAVQLIDQEKLGEDDIPDLLQITFSTLDFANKWYEPVSVEVHDLYLKMDQEIASILNYLDKKMGKGNYLVYLTAPSTSAYSVGYMKEELHFAAGQFSPQSAMALLRSYLNAIYGVGDWIEDYNEEQVYLNHQYIDKKSKSLDDMQIKVAEFLNQFEGIKSAVPACKIETSNMDNSRFKILENSYCVQRTGDVILLLEEGWWPTYKYNTVDYTTDNRVPLVFYGMQVKPGRINRLVSVTDIVPTLCLYLGITSPDEAQGKIISELFW